MTTPKHKKDREARAISDIQPTAISKLLAEAEWRQALVQTVKEQLPKQLAEHCQVLAPNRQEVVLQADQASWATHLRGCCADIRFALARQRNFADIEAVRVRVKPTMKQAKPQKRQLPDCKPISDRNQTLIHAAAQRVNDPTLQNALARLANRRDSESE